MTFPCKVYDQLWYVFPVMYAYQVIVGPKHPTYLFYISHIPVTEWTCNIAIHSIAREIHDSRVLVMIESKGKLKQITNLKHCLVELSTQEKGEAECCCPMTRNKINIAWTLADNLIETYPECCILHAHENRWCITFYSMLLLGVFISSVQTASVLAIR